MSSPRPDPDAYRVILLTEPDAAILDGVQELFEAMYVIMDDFGNMMPLKPDGPATWRHSLERTLGRVGTVAVALDRDDRPVGYLYVVLAVVPGYLEGGKVGRLNSANLLPETRGAGLYRKLYEAAEGWLAENGATALETQVQVANTNAISIYERFGFVRELVQLRKVLTPTP